MQYCGGQTLWRTRDDKLDLKRSRHSEQFALVRRGRYCSDEEAAILQQAGLLKREEPLVIGINERTRFLTTAQAVLEEAGCSLNTSCRRFTTWFTADRQWELHKMADNYSKVWQWMITPATYKLTYEECLTSPFYTERFRTRDEAVQWAQSTLNETGGIPGWSERSSI